MTDTDMIEINHLLSGIVDMKKVYNDNEAQKKETETLRQYCMDALRDWHDTVAKLVDFLNVNRKELGLNAPWCLINCHGDKSRGYFNIGRGEHTIYVFVEGDIRHLEHCADWKAYDMARTDEFYPFPAKEDFIEATLSINGICRNITLDDIGHGDFSLKFWTTLKKYADGTRERTQWLVDSFKAYLQSIKDDYKQRINDFQSAADCGKYEKVHF